MSRVQRSLPLPSFDEEARAFFGVRVPSSSGPSPAAIRKRISAVLGGQGSLRNRYGAFERRFFIPEERIPALMARAVELCRAETRLHVTLPPGERVQLEYVRNKPWDAYSFYKGAYQSVIQINVDGSLTPDRALRLACHEGYPGHHVFNSLAEQNLVGTEHRPEWLVQPAFSPQSLLSEGAASAAGDLAFSPSQREQIEKKVLFPLAGLRQNGIARYLAVEDLVTLLYPAQLSIARDYLDGRLEFRRAAEALEEQTLASNPDGLLRYLNEYRTYITTYTTGREEVLHWVQARSEGAGRSETWKAFAELIQSPELFLNSLKNEAK